MNIILVKDVEPLGKAGKTVVVKDGYARNFLIPRGLALPATTGRRSELSARAALQLRQAEALKRKAAELGERISQVSLSFAVAAGDQGRTHGAVTAKDICEALRRERGIRLEKHQVLLGEPIGRLGAVEVPVKLHPEVTAALKISVVKK